jgi:hypothetical protein
MDVRVVWKNGLGSTIPEKGQYPVTRVDRTDLTANITWYVGTATGSTMQTPTFAPDTVYAAVITLDAKPGYVSAIIS